MIRLETSDSMQFSTHNWLGSSGASGVGEFIVFAFEKSMMNYKCSNLFSHSP